MGGGSFLKAGGTRASKKSYRKIFGFELTAVTFFVKLNQATSLTSLVKQYFHSSYEGVKRQLSACFARSGDMQTLGSAGQRKKLQQSVFAL